MAAQFFSALADNAILIAAFALLEETHAPEAMRPMLKLFFFFSYVALAAFVGAFADSRPKGRVMFLANAVKFVGGVLMLATPHPLLAYAVIGFGAAAYSPAKYGIITEMLPPERLVAANGWIETLTIGAVVFGALLGGVLVSTRFASVAAPYIATLHWSVAHLAIALVCLLYGLAALINLAIPDTGVRYAPQQHTPAKLLADFGHCLRVLWRDKLGQISLAVTTLFWGAGATLQLLVIAWAKDALHMGLARAAILQAVTAIGVAAGAIAAASAVSLRRSLRVLPVGVMMGALVVLVALVDFRAFPDGGIHLAGLHVDWAILTAIGLMLLVGAMAGFFVVPMNALLQHRGYVLLSAGHSIAVQNFNENLGILAMSGIYAALLSLGMSARGSMILFGVFVSATMSLVIVRHRQNQRRLDSEALIGDAHHGLCSE